MYGKCLGPLDDNRWSEGERGEQTLHLDGFAKRAYSDHGEKSKRQGEKKSKRVKTEKKNAQKTGDS